MDDGAEDADALSSGCGRETPDMKPAVSAGKTIGERRWRVPGLEAWRGHLEPDPQTAVAPDLTGPDLTWFRDECGAGSRREREGIESPLAEWLCQRELRRLRRRDHHRTRSALVFRVERDPRARFHHGPRRGIRE